MNREVEQLCKKLRKQGWSVERRKSNHYKFTSPAGVVTFCAATPSDHRSLKNVTACVKRLGAIL